MKPTFLIATLLLLLPSFASESSQQWRTEHRLIDLHQHIVYNQESLARAVRILDASGIGIAVNLSGDTTLPRDGGAISNFERNKRLADQMFPGRFLHYMNLDYARWDEPDWT